MAPYDLHRSSDTPRTAVLSYRVASAIIDIVSRFMAQRSRRSSRVLARLTDWQLADLGINRGDLGKL